MAIAQARREVDLIGAGAVDILATALVQPSNAVEDIKARDAEVERIAMELEIAHEAAVGADVRDVSTPDKARVIGVLDCPGFDLQLNKDKIIPREMPSNPRPTFDSIRQVSAEGGEYWLARDLAPILEYQDWRNFLHQVIEKARTACLQSGHRPEDHFGDITRMVDIGSGAPRRIADIRLSRYACYLIVQNADPTKPVIAHGQTYFALQTRRQELRDEEAYARLTEDEKRLAIRNELATQTEEKLRRDRVRRKTQANQTHFAVG